MIKYSEKQKLDAVASYERGTAGLKATAEAHGVGVDSLRKWVELFRARGLSGIKRTRRTSYDAEFKLAVLRRTEAFGEPLAHLQIQSVSPERAALPVTETGIPVGVHRRVRDHAGRWASGLRSRLARHRRE